MKWKGEWKKLALIAAVFLVCFYFPVEWLQGSQRLRNAVWESLHLVRWYAREHVLRVRTGKEQAVLLATVFARRKLPANITVVDDGLAVTVTVGRTAVRFVYAGRKLVLDRVSGRKA